MSRTFLSLDIDDAVRRKLGLVRRRFGDGRDKINWVPPENLHVTLKFLGDVDDSRLAEVCRAAAEVAGGIGPFDFDVLGLRAIPPGGAVRMIWADVAEEDEETPPAERLFVALEGALQPLGFAPETRAFRPHITLARIRFAGNPNALREIAGTLAAEHFGRVRAEHLTVYTSQLPGRGPGGAKSTGPIYTAVAKPPFLQTGGPAVRR